MGEEVVSTFTFDKEFHEIVSNKEILKRTTEKFLNNIIDDITLGIIFDAHRKFKTKAFNLDRDKSPPAIEENDAPSNIDIFGHHHTKEKQECVCPNCNRAVTAVRFAPHLENCLGMGRVRPRNVRRVVNNNNRDNSSYSGIASDDDDDADWNDRRAKKKKERNGSKKGKVCNGIGTPKKNSENECMDNVDVEGDENGDIASLRDILQDHSNGSSPVDSSSNSSKKMGKTNKKKNHKRDRTSPNVSSNAD